MNEETISMILTSMAILVWAAVIAVIMTFAGSAMSAPFLVSDPWPAGGPQPDTCVATEGASQIPLGLITQGGAKSIRHDMVNIQSGEHTWAIKCENAWSESPSTPFSFAAGGPAAPTGIRLVP